MVMFSCNRCSKGLKKKDVLNHSFQCGGRNNINVTCIDCLKDFRGNEFDKHTSCVTEEARYGGKGVVVKETGKKQNQWLGIVREVLSVNKSLDVPVKKFLQSIQHMENIPRNQKKFHNWANSAMHIKDKSFLDQVFEILQTEFQKRNEANKESAAEKTMDNSTEVVTGVNGEGGKKQEADDVQEDLGNGEVNDKKRKKKKSEKVDESVEEVERMEEETCQAPETKEDDVKLTKKEKKLKKKKAKFEAELQDIENFKKNEQDGEVAEEEAPKKKKSKKRKLAEENGVDKPDEDGEGKDSKRQKVEEDRLNEKGTEGKEVTKRWGNLRDAFSRANRKLKDCKRSGAGAVNIKKYVYADQMQFLSKLFQSREVAESLEGRTYDNDNEIENVDDPTEAPLHPKETPSPRGSKRFRRPDEVEQKMLKALDEPPLSPHVSFINGLMPHLIKFTDNEILEFQMGVLEVISKIANKRQNAAQPPPPFPPQTPSYYHNNYPLPQYPQFPTSQMSNINQPNTFNSFQPRQNQINQSPNPQIQHVKTAKVSNKDSNNYQQSGPSNIRPPGQELNTAKYYEDFGNSTTATSPESYPSTSTSPADTLYSETYDFS